MFPFRTPRAARRLAVVALAGTMLLPGTSARAAAAACRADPVVTLTNGIVLTLYADIANAPAHVQQVRYELHGPVGTSVASAIIPADDPLWGKEQFVYYADSRDTK